MPEESRNDILDRLRGDRVPVSVSLRWRGDAVVPISAAGARSPEHLQNGEQLEHTQQIAGTGTPWHDEALRSDPRWDVTRRSGENTNLSASIHGS